MRQILARIVLALSIGFAMSACFADGINWQPYSSATFAKAKKQHKQVYLFGKASWCPWCKRMKSETFTDSTVVGLINKNYIPVMIDIDSDSSIADRYDVSVVPANIILTGDYKVVASKTGYLTPGQMESFLRGHAS